MLTYEEISKILNLDVERDEKATKILVNLVKKEQLSDFDVVKEKIQNKLVFIFGAGPSLKNDIYSLKKIFGNFENFCLICADGATKCLLENNIYPDFVITDLDGEGNSIVKSNKKAIIVLHAHGDNIEKINLYTKKFKNLILTTQTNIKLPNVYNFGGFTDGDRALFFALNFNPKIVILAGMDFGNEIGEYSKKISGERLKFKLKKLKIGKELIEERCQNLDCVYDFTKNGNLNLKKINENEIKEIFKKYK